MLYRDSFRSQPRHLRTGEPDEARRLELEQQARQELAEDFGMSLTWAGLACFRAERSGATDSLIMPMQPQQQRAAPAR